MSLPCPSTTTPARPALHTHAGQGLLAHWRQDLPASIVVFLVALPLCLGIALASGAPLIAGLVSGIVGGLVVASLSGSELSVSGPAAGLVVIVLDAIARLGSIEAFLAAVLVAGVLQFILGHLRAGNLGACFPSPVIKGMLAAIGVLLIVKQMPVLFGFQNVAQMVHLPADVWTPQAWHEARLGPWQPGPVVVGLVALGMLVAWDRPAVRRLPWLGSLPGPLVAVLFGVAYHALTTGATGPGNLALLDEHRVSLPTIDSLAGLQAQLLSPDWTALTRPELYPIAVTLAVVASLETLLSLEASDRLDPLKRISPPNRELRAQGVGNIVAGLLGGLPITAVIVRSSANVQAGARSRLSAIVHGLLLLASLLLLAGVLRWIPLAALAAVLVHTGYKLAKPAHFHRAWRDGLAVFVPFIVTLGAILATDLLIGICIGLGCSMLFVIHANTRHAVSMTSHDGAHLLRLGSNVSFFSKAALRSHLARVQEGEAIVIDGSRARFLDSDIREALNDFKAHAAERGIEVEERTMALTPPRVVTPRPLRGAHAAVRPGAAGPAGA